MRNLILSAIAILTCFPSANAQTSQERKPLYDTTYIARPYGRLTLKTRANLSGDGIHARGTVNDIYSKADLHTDNKLTFSIAAIYRGIAVGLAINPAKIFGHYNDYELNVNFYSTRLSVDASYQRASSLSGDINRTGYFHLEEGQADMKVLNVAAYYCFNYRHFSYPAVFTQSYLQRRSAGSWLAGISFQGGTINTNTNDAPNLPDFRIKAQHLGIGGGYGYNFVIRDKWIFHLSALPTIVILNYNNLTINGERKKAQPIRLNMILNERMAIVYNLSSKYFLSLSGVMNNSIFDDDVVVVNQNKWRVRTAFGIRL